MVTGGERVGAGMVMEDGEEGREDVKSRYQWEVERVEEEEEEDEEALEEEEDEGTFAIFIGIDMEVGTEGWRSD